jgi:hypothetical protein
MYVLASMPPSGNSLVVLLAINSYIDVIVSLRKGNLEALLNCLQNLLVSFAAHEGDRQPLGAETASTTNPMKVRISVTWQVIVDSKVNTLDINATTKHIGRDTNTLVELLKLFVTLDAGWEVSKILCG